MNCFLHFGVANRVFFAYSNYYLFFFLFHWFEMYFFLPIRLITRYFFTTFFLLFLLPLCLVSEEMDLKKWIDMYYQNVRGLNTKADIFYTNTISFNYDVMLLTEIWLTPNVNSENILTLGMWFPGMIEIPILLVIAEVEKISPHLKISLLFFKCRISKTNLRICG